MYQKHIETTKKSNALNNLQSIRMAQEEYKADNNAYDKTDNSSSCSSDKNSTINTNLFEGTKVLDESSDKKYLIGNFSKEIIEDNIIENNRYIFCEEKERKRNFDEIINYTKTNNKIKNTWPKNKIMIYSPFLKRSGNKLKQYKCVKNKNFKIVKKFDNGVMLIQRD